MTKSLAAEIKGIKRRLTHKAKVNGIYENFGQAELHKLKENHNYSSLVYGSSKDRLHASEIDAFEDWAISYCGS